MSDWNQYRNLNRSQNGHEDDAGVLTTLVYAFRVVKMRWKAPIWFLLSFWLMGALYYSFAPRHYRSEAEVMIHKVGHDELLLGSEPVLEEVVRKLTSSEMEIFSGVSPERKIAFIREKITMSYSGGRSNVLRISYPHKDPRIAQFILATIVKTFKKFADNEELRRRIDPNSVRKNAFARRLLNELNQRKELLDSQFDRQRIELLLAYKELLNQVPPKIIPIQALDQLPKNVRNNRQYLEPNRLQSPEEGKIILAKGSDSDIRKKITNLINDNYETKVVGELTEMIADMVSLTRQQIDDRGEILLLSNPNYPAIPERPFSLKLLFILTTSCGLIFGFGFVCLADRLDDRIRSTSEIERILLSPVLGTISVSNSDAKPNLESAGSFPLGEDVQELAASIRSQKRRLRSFVVASPKPNKKSAVATVHLAAALGDQQEKILLIDADLRSRWLSQHLSQERTPGFGELLERDVSADGEDICPVSLISINEKVTFLPAGKFSGDLISRFSRSETKHWFTVFEKEFDRVIVHAPDFSTASDAAVLAGHLDGCLLQCSRNTTRGTVRKAMQILQKFRIGKIGGLMLQIRKNR